MIPDELKALHQWVCAKKDSKNPWQAMKDEPASVSKPETWGSYDEAARAVEDGMHDYVGFVFNDNGIVGIDIDDAVDECGVLSETARDILNFSYGYAEYSRSGTGLHLLMYGTLPFDGRNNRKGVEIYKNGRYFILTGNVIGERCRMEEDQDTIDYVVERYFPEMRRKDDFGIRRVVPRIYNPKWAKAEKGAIPLRPKYPEITPGSRNICLTSLAGLMRTQGYAKGQIYAELLYANRMACKPPLSTREIQNIVTSVERYDR